MRLYYFETLERRDLMDAASIYGPALLTSDAQADVNVPVIVADATITTTNAVSLVDLSSLVGPVPQAQAAAAKAARVVYSQDVVIVEQVSDAPNAPTGLAFGNYNQTTRRLSMSWNAADNANGYRIEYSTDSGATWRLGGYTFGTTERYARDVDSEKTYIFRVAAINERGQSDWLTGVWNYAESVKPAAPTNFNVYHYDAEKGVVRLTWDASTSSDIIYYPSEYSTDGGVTWKSAGNVKANRQFRDATKCFGVVDFRVCALDSSGRRSDWTYCSFDPVIYTAFDPVPEYLQ